MHTSSLLNAALLAGMTIAAPSRLRQRESNSTADNLELIHKLELAPTAADRVNMLTDDDFIYDFLAPPVSPSYHWGFECPIRT
jgi:hypothetical protein